MVATHVTLVYGVVVKLSDLGRAVNISDDEIDDWVENIEYYGAKLSDRTPTGLTMLIVPHDHARRLSALEVPPGGWACVGCEICTVGLKRCDDDFDLSFPYEDVHASKKKFEDELEMMRLESNGSTTTTQESPLVNLIANGKRSVHLIRNDCMCCS